MKTGRSLEQLAAELTRQVKTKKDFLVPTTALSLERVVGPAPIGELVDGPPVTVRFGDQNLAPRPLFHEQLGSHLQIPKPYYDRMLETAPALLAENVNHWLASSPGQKRMVRTLDGKARAFLSDRFMTLDNYDLAAVVLPILQKAGAQIISCDVTETRFYIKAIDEKISGQVPTGKAMGDGSHTIFDTCCAAITIRNSEVGLGSFEIASSVFTKACTNLATFGDRSIRRSHVGSRHELGEEVYALLSDETIRVDQAATWGKVRDLAAASFDEARFKALTDKMTAAVSDKIDADPAKVVEVVQARFGISDEERGAVLMNLVRGGDLTRYGLFNAVTRTAEDLAAYDRATDFERLGGEIVELPADGWKQILDAAATASRAPAAPARKRRARAVATA